MSWLPTTPWTIEFVRRQIHRRTCVSVVGTVHHDNVCCPYSKQLFTSVGKQVAHPFEFHDWLYPGQVLYSGQETNVQGLSDGIVKHSCLTRLTMLVGFLRDAQRKIVGLGAAAGGVHHLQRLRHGGRQRCRVAGKVLGHPMYTIREFVSNRPWGAAAQRQVSKTYRGMCGAAPHADIYYSC